MALKGRKPPEGTAALGACPISAGDFGRSHGGTKGGSERKENAI